MAREKSPRPKPGKKTHRTQKATTAGEGRLRALLTEAGTQAGELVGKVVGLISAEKISEAVEDAASVSGIAAKLFLKPIVEKLSEKNDAKFYQALIKIAEQALETPLQSARLDGGFGTELEKRLGKFTVNLKQSLAENESGTVPAFAHPLLFPPVVAVRGLLDEILISARVASDERLAFLSEFNRGCLNEFAGKSWGEYFADWNSDANRHNLDLYLAGLRDAPNAPTAPGRPSLREIYVEERAYLQIHDGFGGIDPRNGELVENLRDFLDVYLGEKKVGRQPHYTDSYRGRAITFPILIIAADYGTGKSTTARMLAADYAHRHLATGNPQIPVLIEMKHLREATIEHFVGSVLQFQLQPDEPYLFILDALDESGPPTDAHFEVKLNECKLLLEDRFKQSRIVITTRPVGGTQGGLARKIGSLCGRYLHLEGFDKERCEKYIEARKHNDPALSSDLTFELIARSVLMETKDQSKPLLLDMVVELFRDGVILIDQVNGPGASLDRTELYSFFLRNLSTHAKRGVQPDKEELNRRPLFRYFLRKMAARRQFLDTYYAGEAGIDLAHFKSRALDEKDRKKFQDIEMDELVLVSHFGKQGSHVEFLHLSFREFLTAEYLLEILLLGVKNQGQRHQLHIGYVSDACLEFFEQLTLKWRQYLDHPNDKSSREMFREFLLSVQAASDQALERFIDKDGFLKSKGVIELSARIYENAYDWATDERPLVARAERPVYSCGEELIRPIWPLAFNHTYCERWYALILLQALRERKLVFSTSCELWLRESLVVTGFGRGCLRFVRRLNFRGANLSGANLSEANLSEANLSGANLSKADLSKADLSKADLSKADLSKADLSKADLSKADLSKADLSEANLSEANLSGANLSGANLLKAKLWKTNLSGADISGATLWRANLVRANLSRVNLGRADIRGVNLLDSNLADANLLQTFVTAAKIHEKWKTFIEKQNTTGQPIWLTDDD